jgi:hypothetical protein
LSFRNKILLVILCGLGLIIYLKQSHDQSDTMAHQTQNLGSDLNHPNAEVRGEPIVDRTNPGQSLGPVSNSNIPTIPTVGVTENELEELIQKTMAVLPEIGKLKFAPGEDPHQTPGQLIDAGNQLGELAEYLERHPEQFRSASGFYADCAAKESLVTAIRAVCYHALMLKRSEWQNGVSERISRVTPDVIDIANQL